MRISFDIDETLILSSGTEGTRLPSGEVLRPGAVELLQEVAAEHELWLYTTSLRNELKLKAEFWWVGVAVSRVVNGETHALNLVSNEIAGSPSKLPPMFHIELHVDDSPGVVEEGEVWGFRVLQVEPDDRGWADTVRAAIRSEDP